MRDINPDGALPLFIGGVPPLAGRGCKYVPHGISSNYSLLTTHCNLHPLTAKAVPIDFATLIFLLLVRHSINKFILCPYFVRRFPL